LCALPQVSAAQAAAAEKEQALSAALSAKAQAEQQMDRLTQHLDSTEAQLQEAKSAMFKAQVRSTALYRRLSCCCLAMWVVVALD
jgi:chromosome segregation ATPase